VMAVVLGKINILYQYAWQQPNLVLSRGLDIPHLGVFNAFGTNLLPMYLDGGLVLVGAIHLVFGVILGSCRSDEEGFCSPAPILIFFVLVFGLFQPVVNSALAWVPALLLGGETARDALWASRGAATRLPR